MRFGLFLVVGGFAALVNLAMRWLLNLAVPYELAVAAAYLCGMTVAFTFNKLFVFSRSGRAAHREYLRFAIVNVVAFVQVFVVSVGLARWLFPLVGFTFHADAIAHGIGVGSPVITRLPGPQILLFRRRRSGSDIDGATLAGTDTSRTLCELFRQMPMTASSADCNAHARHSVDKGSFQPTHVDVRIGGRFLRARNAAP
jgi:putative flippase GtrA